jgi:phage shock protein PspC (stress-responsive transcriptional regulator)
MFTDCWRAEDWRMTTEQHTVPRRLRRRSDERVIAGVASGLGDYFNIDPLLVRIALVASLVFGGLGLFLYGAAWLLVPDDESDKSIVERMFGGGGGALPGGLLVLAGLLIGLSIVGGIASSSETAGALALALIVIAVGAVLLRRGGPEDAGVVESVAPATADGTAGVAAAAAPPAARRPRRPPSPLGWFVVGAALVAMGVIALASSAWALPVDPGLYAGVALGIIGIGLLVGTWFGHARFLIVLGLLLLPFAWMASLIDVPLQGAWGSHRFSPTSATEVRETYHVAGGELVLDLTRVVGDGEPITVDAEVAVGDLLVLLPDEASIELDATVGGGVMRVLGGPTQDGTHLTDRRVIDAGEPEFILDLEAGIGRILVGTRESEGR